MIDVAFPYEQFEYEQAPLGSLMIAPDARTGKAVIAIKATWDMEEALVVLSPNEDPGEAVPIAVGLSKIRPGRMWVVPDAKLSIDHSPETMQFDRAAKSDRLMVGAICVKRGGDKLLAITFANQPTGVGYLDFSTGIIGTAVPSGTWFYRWLIARPQFPKGWQTICSFPVAK